MNLKILFFSILSIILINSIIIYYIWRPKRFDVSIFDNINDNDYNKNNICLQSLTDLNSHLNYQRHFIHSDYINLLPCVLDINYNFDSDFHIIIIGSTSSVGISLIKMLKESKIEYVEVRNRIHFNMLRDPIWEIFDQMQNNILIFDFQHIYDEYATKRLNSYAKKRNIPIVRLVSSFLNDNYSYQLQVPMVFGPNYQRISDCTNSFYYDCIINNTQKIYECPLSTQYVLSYDLAKYLLENLEPVINQNFTKPMHIIPNLQFYSSKEIMSHISKTRPQCKWKNDDKKEINKNNDNQRKNEQQQQQKEKQQNNEQQQDQKQEQQQKQQQKEKQQNNEQQQDQKQEQQKQQNNEQKQQHGQQQKEKEKKQSNEQQKQQHKQQNNEQQQQKQQNNEQQQQKQQHEQQKEKEKQQNNEQQKQEHEQQQQKQEQKEKEAHQSNEQQKQQHHEQQKQHEKQDQKQQQQKQQNNEQQKRHEQQQKEKEAQQNNEQQQKQHEKQDQKQQQQKQQNNEQQKQQNNEQQQKQQKNEQRRVKQPPHKNEQQQNSRQRQQGRLQEKNSTQQFRSKQKEGSEQHQQNLQKQKNKSKESSKNEASPNNIINIKQNLPQNKNDINNIKQNLPQNKNDIINIKQNLPQNKNNIINIKSTPSMSKNSNEKPSLLGSKANDRESKLSDSFLHVDESFNSIIPDLSSPYVSHVTTISDLPRVVSYHQIIMNTISQILPHFPLINVEFITVYTSSKDTKFSDLYEIPPNLAKYHVEVNIPSKILKEINKRIKSKYFPEYVLRNIGVRRARGVYIIAGSSDVLMPPGFFISAEQLLFNPLTIIRSVRENAMPVEVPRVIKDFNKYFYSITYWAHTDIGINQMKLSLLCDASGDFQGCHRLMWEAVNGYVESNLIFHVDSAFEFDLCRLLTPIMIRFLPGEKHLIHTKISTSTQHLHLLDLYNRFFAYNGWMSWHDNYRPNWGHGTLNDLL